jgi:hypothetical protein
MKLKSNKKSAKVGEPVMLEWDCPYSANTQMIIDNGYSKTAIDVSQSGSQTIIIGSSRDDVTKVYVKGLKDGKGYTLSKDINVDIPKAKVESTWTGFSGKGKSRLMDGIKSTWSRLKYGWSILPQQKKLAYIIMQMIMLTLIIALFLPKAILWCLMGIVCYLLWYSYKK